MNTTNDLQSIRYLIWGERLLIRGQRLPIWGERVLFWYSTATKTGCKGYQFRGSDKGYRFGAEEILNDKF